ncbi:sigma-70 family RNA polymerase sigma factor [Dactylosporangium sp. NPDC050588]|uniref:RNA polymerase sigma factor n=1 Tax=Dactylosporangium sp. NPDC050588 TaxID=3157211 RepID=UPI0033F71A4D
MSGAVEQAYREHWPRLLALLVTRLRRFDLAEESLQDAFAAAVERWDRDGVPANPAGWLMTAAWRRALDRVRREDADRERLPLLVVDAPGTVTGAATEACAGDEVGDERLRLLFACCHPALAPDARTALMLRFGAGLTTAEIARLCLVPEPTMAARLTRAKKKIAQAGIPLRAPAPADLADRLDGLLTAVYLLFSEGYRATGGPVLLRPRLAREAIRLGYELGLLLPDEPEPVALLALMVLQHARRDARVDADGHLVRLTEQDRSRWHPTELRHGFELLAFVRDDEGSGRYALEALIAAEHAKAVTAAGTDWARIAGLYARLEARTGSPVVRLNRAVAVAEAGDPALALALTDEAAERLPRHHLVPAVRAELLQRLGRPGEAGAAWEASLRLVRTEPERQHLLRRAAAAPAPRS